MITTVKFYYFISSCKCLKSRTAMQASVPLFANPTISKMDSVNNHLQVCSLVRMELRNSYLFQLLHVRLLLLQDARACIWLDPNCQCSLYIYCHQCPSKRSLYSLKTIASTYGLKCLTGELTSALILALKKKPLVIGCNLIFQSQFTRNVALSKISSLSKLEISKNFVNQIEILHYDILCDSLYCK